MSLSEILDCTWFRFRGSETVVETGVGSRPGDNCADLVFSYLFACMLRDIRSDLHSEEVLTVIPWAEALQGRLQPVGEGDLPTSVLPLLDSTWMDDLAIMLMAPTAAALPEVTARAHSIAGRPLHGPRVDPESCARQDRNHYGAAWGGL